MIKADNKIIKSYFKNNKRLVSFYFHPKFTQRGSDKIELVFQKSFAKSLNKKIFNINPLLQLKLPAQETIFRAVSDSKKKEK